jgi:uncharacterized membrane protein YbhN (UPF0104 family)
MAVVLTVMVVYAWYNRDTFSGLLHIRWDYMLCLTLLWVPYEAIPGWRTKLFLEHYGANLSFIEWFGLSVITDMANWILPFQGGIVPTAMYLKRQHNLPYTQYVSIMVGSYVLFFLSSSVMGLVVTGLVYWIYGKVSPVALLFFSCILLGTLLFLMVSPKLPPSRFKLAEYARSVLEGWTELKNDRSLVISISAIFSLGSILTSLIFFISYRALSLDVDFLPTMVLGLISGYAIFIKLTPGNLGIREAIVALTSEMIGTGFHEGFAAAVLFRGINLLLIVIFGPLFSYLLTRRVSSSGTMA